MSVPRAASNPALARFLAAARQTSRSHSPTRSSLPRSKTSASMGSRKRSSSKTSGRSRKRGRPIRRKRKKRKKKPNARAVSNINKLRRGVFLRKAVGLAAGGGAPAMTPLQRAMKILLAERRAAGTLKLAEDDQDTLLDGLADEKIEETPLLAQAAEAAAPAASGWNALLRSDAPLLSIKKRRPKVATNQPISPKPGAFPSKKASAPHVAFGRFKKSFGPKVAAVSRFKGAARKIAAAQAFRARRRAQQRVRAARRKRVKGGMAKLKAVAKFSGALKRIRGGKGLRRAVSALIKPDDDEDASPARSSPGTPRSGRSSRTRKLSKSPSKRPRNKVAARKLRSVVRAAGLAAGMNKAAAARARRRRQVLARHQLSQARHRQNRRSPRVGDNGPVDSGDEYSSCSSDCSCSSYWTSEPESGEESEPVPGWVHKPKQRMKQVMNAANTLAGIRARLDGLMVHFRAFVASAVDVQSGSLDTEMQAASAEVIKAENCRTFALSTPDSEALALQFVQAVPVAESKVEQAAQSFADVRLSSSTAIESLKTTVGDAAASLSGMPSTLETLQKRYAGLPLEYQQEPSNADTMASAERAIKAAHEAEQALLQATGATSLTIEALNLRTKLPQALAQEARLAEHYTGRVHAADACMKRAASIVAGAERVTLRRQLLVDAAAVSDRIEEARTVIATLVEANEQVYSPDDTASEALRQAQAALGTAEGLHAMPPSVADKGETVKAVEQLMQRLEEAQAALEHRREAVSRVVQMQERLQRHEQGDEDEAKVLEEGKSDGDAVSYEDAAAAMAVCIATLKALFEQHPAIATGHSHKEEVPQGSVQWLALHAAELVEATEGLHALMEADAPSGLAAGEGNGALLEKYVERTGSATAAVQLLALKLYQKTHPSQVAAQQRAQKVLVDMQTMFGSILESLEEQRKAVARGEGSSAPPPSGTEALVTATQQQLRHAQAAYQQLVGPLATPASIQQFIQLVGQAERSVERVAQAYSVLSDKGKVMMRLMAVERRLMQAQASIGESELAVSDEATALLSVAQSSLQATKILADETKKGMSSEDTVEALAKALQVLETQATRVEKSLRDRHDDMLGHFLDEFKEAESKLARYQADVEHLKREYRKAGLRVEAVDADLEVASTAVASAETVRNIVKASPDFQRAVQALLDDCLHRDGEGDTSEGGAAELTDEALRLTRKFVSSVEPAANAVSAASTALANVGVAGRLTEDHSREVLDKAMMLQDVSVALMAAQGKQRVLENISPDSKALHNCQTALQSAEASLRHAMLLGGACERSPADQALFTKFLAAAARAQGAMKAAAETQSAVMTSATDPLAEALAVLGSLEVRLDGLQHKLQVVRGTEDDDEGEEAITRAVLQDISASRELVAAAEALRGTVTTGHGDMQPALRGSLKRGALSSAMAKESGRKAAPRRVKRASSQGTSRESEAGSAPTTPVQSPREGEKEGEAEEKGEARPTASSSDPTEIAQTFISAVARAANSVEGVEGAVGRVCRVLRLRREARFRGLAGGVEFTKEAARLAALEEQFHRHKARDLACGEAASTLEGMMIASTLLGKAREALDAAAQVEARRRDAEADGVDVVTLDSLADQVVSWVRSLHVATGQAEEAIRESLQERLSDAAVLQARELSRVARHVAAVNKLATVRSALAVRESETEARADALFGDRLLHKEYVETLEDQAVARISAAEELQPRQHGAGADGRAAGKAQEDGCMVDAKLSAFVVAVGDAHTAYRDVEQAVLLMDDYNERLSRHAKLPGSLDPTATGLTTLEQCAGSSSTVAALVDGPTSYGRMVEEFALSHYSLDVCAQLNTPLPSRFASPEDAPQLHSGLGAGLGADDVLTSPRKGGLRRASSMFQSSQSLSMTASTLGTESTVLSPRRPRLGSDHSHPGSPRHNRSSQQGQGQGQQEPEEASFQPHSLDAGLLEFDIRMCTAREKAVGYTFRQLIAEVQQAHMSSLPLETGLPLKQAISNATTSLRSTGKFRQELAKAVGATSGYKADVLPHDGTSSVGASDMDDTASLVSAVSLPAVPSARPRRKSARSRSGAGSSSGSLLSMDTGSVRGLRSSIGSRKASRGANHARGGGDSGVLELSLNAAFAAASELEELVREANMNVCTFATAYEVAAQDLKERGDKPDEVVKRTPAKPKKKRRQGRGQGQQGHRQGGLPAMQPPMQPAPMMWQQPMMQPMMGQHLWHRAAGAYSNAMAFSPMMPPQAMAQHGLRSYASGMSGVSQYTGSASQAGGPVRRQRPSQGSVQPPPSVGGASEESKGMHKAFTEGASGWARYRQQMQAQIQAANQQQSMAVAAAQYRDLMERRLAHERMMEQAQYNAQRARWDARRVLQPGAVDPRIARFQSAGAHSQSFTSGVAPAGMSPVRPAEPTAGAGLSPKKSLRAVLKGVGSFKAAGQRGRMRRAPPGRAGQPPPTPDANIKRGRTYANMPTRHR